MVVIPAAIVIVAPAPDDVTVAPDAQLISVIPAPKIEPPDLISTPEMTPVKLAPLP